MHRSWQVFRETRFEFDPNSPAGRFALGNALFPSGDYALAIPELKASLK